MSDAEPAVVDDALKDGEVEWVSFCPPPEGNAGWVLAPDTALSGESAADLVASWRDDDLTTDCTRTPRSFEIQIGWADGTIGRLGASTDRMVLEPDAGCAPATVAVGLVTALGAERDASYAASEPRPWPGCPDRLDLTGLSADGASAPDLGTHDERPTSRQPILLATAARALVCAYAGKEPRFERSWELSGSDAEEVRATLQAAVRPGEADCGITARPSYVVVLEDLTGTRRAASINGPTCGPTSAMVGTPPRETYLGLDYLVSELLTSSG